MDNSLQKPPKSLLHEIFIFMIRNSVHLFSLFYKAADSLCEELFTTKNFNLTVYNIVPGYHNKSQIDYVWSSYWLLWQECAVTLYHCRQCIPQEVLAARTGARSLWYSSEEKKVGKYVLW